MNLPNKLTILRAVMIPFFLVFLYIPGGWSKWVALAIFIAASLTDMLDGKIARKYNLVTNFGKFMDPLADKLLVCSALIALSDLDRIPEWIQTHCSGKRGCHSCWMVGQDQDYSTDDHGWVPYRQSEGILHF